MPRGVKIGLAVVAFLSVVVLALSALTALSVERHLEEGRAAMERARRQLLASDAERAAHSFAEASDAFLEATDGMETPWIRAVGWIPFLGRTPDAVTAIAYAGRETSTAGEILAVALAELPGGLGSLSPSHGRFPVERIGGLADAVGEAADLVRDADARIAASPDQMLPDVVLEARWKAEAELRALANSLGAAEGILRGLPSFLGSDRPHHYFFGAESPAELRGTGGLIGAYSILTIDDGHFEFSDFQAIQDLPILRVRDVESPSVDYSRNYDYYRTGNGFWLNANMTPDFPSAARAYELSYEEATGEDLDGVVVADPFALQALLDITGSTRVPQLGVRVGAGNVVDFTTNEAYTRFEDQRTRKLVLGAVAADVFERFLDLPHSSLRQLRVLADAAAEGHISVFSEDPVMQEGLAATGVGGAFPRPGGDFFSVLQNNGSGVKIDYYGDRTVTYAVDLDDDGGAQATATVRFTNDAPDSGLPRYLIGPYPGVTEAGENILLVNLYCGADCLVTEASRDGEPVELVRGSELGHIFYRDYFHIPGGSSSELSAELSIPEAWKGNTSGGTYRFAFLNQTTIRPTRVRIEIRLPEGMRLAEASEGLHAEGDLLVYEGVPGRLLELEVTFRPPFLVRIWRNVTRFLSEPIVHLE